MSKIICDICGTAYPETASQCPICGCAKPGSTGTPAADGASEGGERTYTYVKGGRFSRSNVRKRNRENAVASMEEEDDDNYMMDYGEPASNKGLVIAVILLILAIAAVVAYIVLHYTNAPAAPNPDQYNAANTVASTSQEETRESTAETTEPDLSCTQLTLEESAVTLYDAGAAYLIHPTVLPENTPDPITYTSADSSVAEVNSEGRITAVAVGTTTIRVTCGDQVADFTVTCETGPDPNGTYALHINGEDVADRRFKNDVTLPEGSGFRLALVNMDTGEPVDVEWEIDNPKVCTIKDSIVYYVAPGSTRIRVTIGDKTYECIVSCS